MNRRATWSVPVATAAASVLVMSACTDKVKLVISAGNDIDVVSTDDKCTLSSTNARRGNLRFAVENMGSQITEFSVYDADGVRIVGEVENIGPGITRKLIVNAKPGTYTTACKPGATGTGIRASFSVS